jgi:hypothetical protein
MELTGMMAIAAVLTGSVLVALFVGETLITWTIRAMDVGVKRAEARRLSLEVQPSSRFVTNRNPRLQRV